MFLPGGWAGNDNDMMLVPQTTVIEAGDAVESEDEEEEFNEEDDEVDEDDLGDDDSEGENEMVVLDPDHVS